MTSTRDMEIAADILQCAAHIRDISFYCHKSDLPECSNKPAELKCRVYAVHPLTKVQVENLAMKLNIAMRPILEEQSDDLMKQVCSKLGGPFAELAK